MKINKGDKIRFKDRLDDEYREAVVTSRSGRATGKFRNIIYNVVTNTDDEFRVDLDKVVIAEICEDKANEDVIHFAEVSTQYLGRYV